MRPVSVAASVRVSRGERGVVLFVALIVLIIMTLAGLALLRQMGAGVSIAGNIAFNDFCGVVFCTVDHGIGQGFGKSQLDVIFTARSAVQFAYDLHDTANDGVHRITIAGKRDT